MKEEITFRPTGYGNCYLALDALQVGEDITPEEYRTIKAMLDSSDMRI